MEMLGIADLDIAWLFIAIFLLLIVLIVLFIMQNVKYNKLRKKYEKFMRGKNAKSLEQDIIALYEDNKFIKRDNEANRKDIREIMKKLDYCYQKIGLVKYDAFKQMGGQLSFCLCLLDDRNCGFIINSVHSSDGCYSYTKEIKKGECDISLGTEEQKALDMAMGK